MKRVLVVEDEPTIAAGLEDSLQAEGYLVEVVDDGPEAEARAAAGGFDLVLLDVMLPGKDGFAVCRSLRQAGIRVPIIILTAKGQEADKVLGLDLGADDYVTKPFSARELHSRIKAVIRRHEEPHVPVETFKAGGLVIDFVRFEASRDGIPVSLTATEFRMLQVLAEHGERALTLRQLMRFVWGESIHVTERAVYTHINNLRGKIEENPSKPQILVSVRGIGYRLNVTPSAPN
jgi:two-component system alkaline phosphatase synthesis response regulator PhoP